MQRFTDNILISRIIIALVALLVVFATGSVGYNLIEGISVFDGFYMTFITITTIGFAELVELSVGGRIFTVGIFVLGVGVISYIASQATQIFFESELFRRRAMQKQIDNLEQHYIIAGYGRIGKRIAEVLDDANIPTVILEQDENTINNIKKDGLLYIEGDAQDEQNLKDAGIKRAKGLIGALSRDQDNIFVTLTARDLNADLFILTRTYEQKNTRKILRAGANKVISPYEIGADRMANAILRPNVDQFIDNILGRANQEYFFDEVKIFEDSPLIDRTLEEAQIRQKYSVVVIAIISDEGPSIEFNPGGDDTLQEGDSLVLIGDYDHIKEFREEACKDFRTIDERVSNYDFIQHINSLKN